MTRYLTLDWMYRYASAAIILGFAMLCQPFSHDIFVYGFPVLLAGVILFLVLDHLPARAEQEEEEHV